MTVPDDNTGAEPTATLPRANIPERWLPVLAGLASLLPLLVYRERWQALFYFGDDWDNINQLSQMGALRWIFRVFNEHFIPVHKALWLALLKLGGGSHFVILVGLWLVHAATAAMLCALLRAAGWFRFAAIGSGLFFGLASIHIETLAWTINLSNVVSTLALAVGLWWVFARRLDQEPGRLSSALTLVLCSALSAFSMARGVLTGPVFALALLAPPPMPWSTERRWHWRNAAATIIPAAATLVIILAFSRGAKRDVIHHLPEVARYFFGFLTLNPLHSLTGLEGVGTRMMLLVGAVKLGIMLAAWRVSAPRQRRVLLCLGAAMVGDALLVGYGRFHTPEVTIVSSRYQYFVLLTFAPFLLTVIDAALRRLAVRLPRRAAALVPLAGLVLVTAAAWRGWDRQTRIWSDWRGHGPRQVLLHDPNPPATGTVPGIPPMPTARAKELIEQFDLK